MADKPKWKVLAKDAATGDRISLAAWWENEGGRLAGGLDARVISMTVVLNERDGSTRTIVITNERGAKSHFVDLYDEARAPARQGSFPEPPRSAPRSVAAPKPPQGGNDDDIPF